VFDGSKKRFSFNLAGVTPLFDSAGVDDKCGYGLGFGLIGSFRIAVDIELRYAGFRADEFADLIDYRSHVLAVGTPGGVEFDHYYRG